MSTKHISTDNLSTATAQEVFDIDALLDKALLPVLVQLPNKATAAEVKLVESWNEGQIKRHKEFLIQLAAK